MKRHCVFNKNLSKLGFSFLLVFLNRLIITLASFEAAGGKLVWELLNFNVFRQAFYVSFARYDAGWYAQIAQQGYVTEKSSVFFPLYPLLMRAVSAITGLSYKVSGQVISILCFFVSLWLVQVLSECTEALPFAAHKRQAGRFIACIIAFHPLAYYYTIPYTESLFLMITLLFLIFTTRGKWLAAGFCGFFAGLTRNSGVLLAIIFLFEYLKSILPECRRKGLLERCSHYLHALLSLVKGFRLRYFVKYKSFFSIVLIPLGAVAYFVYLFLKFGSMAGPIKGQGLFGRSTMFPFLTLYYGLRHAIGKLKAIAHLDLFDQSHLFHYYLLQFLSVCFFIIAVIYLINRLPLSYNLFMIASLILPLCKPAYTGVVDYFVSFPRYTITLFPYFAAVYGILKGSKKALVFYLAGSIYLLIMSAYFWCLGRFMA